MKPRKLPSGSWFVQVQAGGIRRGFTAKTRAEVVRKAQAYQLTRSDAPAAPLGSLIDEYIESKRQVLSPSTIARYEQMRRLDFQRLMDIPARELSSARMQAEINAMASDHSSKSVRNAYGLVSAALAQHGIVLRVTLPKPARAHYAVPSTEEVFALISASGENMKTAIMLAAFCGLRRGEIAALKSSDIDGSLIHVRRALVYDSNRQAVSKSPKTYTSDRVVSAPDFVVSHLKGKTGRICPLALNSITRRFCEVRDSLGLSCRFHDLRHFYASALHAVGVRDQYIMKFGGWKSDHVLKSVYRGTLDEFEADAAARSSAYFERSANEMLTKPKKSP